MWMKESSAETARRTGGKEDSFSALYTRLRPRRWYHQEGSVPRRGWRNGPRNGERAAAAQLDNNKLKKEQRALF